MARRKSAARPAPRQKRSPPPPPKKPTQQAQQTNVPTAPPTQQTNVPTIPPKQPTALANQKQPGLFGQMASTAAGVAIGHSIGHGITGLFSGNKSTEIPDQQEPQSEYVPQSQYEQPQYQAFQNDNYGAVSCENDAKALTKCLELNNHNISLCQFYLENLKACQQMASQL